MSCCYIHMWKALAWLYHFTKRRDVFLVLFCLFVLLFFVSWFMLLLVFCFCLFVCLFGFYCVFVLNPVFQMLPRSLICWFVHSWLHLRFSLTSPWQEDIYSGIDWKLFSRSIYYSILEKYKSILRFRHFMNFYSSHRDRN